MSITSLGGGNHSRSPSPSSRPSSSKKIKLFGQKIEAFKLFGQTIDTTSDSNTPVEFMSTQLIAGHNLLAKELTEKNSDTNIAGTSHPLNADDQEKLENSKENSDANIAGTSHPLNADDQEKLENFKKNPIKEFFPFEFEENQNYPKCFASGKSWARLAGLSNSYHSRMMSHSSIVGLVGFMTLIATYQIQKNFQKEGKEKLTSIKNELKNIPINKDFLNAVKDAKEKFLNKITNFSKAYEKTFEAVAEEVNKGKILSLQDIEKIYYKKKYNKNNK